MENGAVRPVMRERSLAPFVPGEALLSAPVLAAMVFTAVNDHWLKAAAPGWITGKLSDFTGLYFFPFLLVALLELSGELCGRVRRGARADRLRWVTSRTLGALLFMEGAVFTALKTSPAFASWLEVAWRAAFGLRARFTPDPTDLCGLIVLPLAWRTARSRGLVRRERSPTREVLHGLARKLVLVPLGLLLGSCTSFKIRGYEGRSVDYVPVSAEAESEAGAPRLVRSDDVLLAFYPFRIAWVPHLGWLNPGQHEHAVEGWIWIENESREEIRVVSPELRTPAPGPIAAGIAITRSQTLVEPWHTIDTPDGPTHGQVELPAGKGAWIQAWIPFDQDFTEHFELRFRWQGAGEEHTIPVAYARVQP